MNWRVIEICPETGDEEVLCETRWKSEALSAAEVFASQSAVFGMIYRVVPIHGAFR